MNLVIDFGNTRIKAAVFENNRLSGHFVFNTAEELLGADVLNLPIRHCLIGSVTRQHEVVYEALAQKMQIRIFTNDCLLPLKNLYTSALTLGSDRLSASVGAHFYFPDKNVLTIDAGTCIKYNFVTAANDYLGGAISPGIPMRLHAMHAQTSALPSIEIDKTYQELIGTSTRGSLLSGALVGAVCEVDGMIQRYQALYPDLQVVITGGDSDYLCSQLKSRFFADQFLILQGLHTILLHNIEK